MSRLSLLSRTRSPADVLDPQNTQPEIALTIIRRNLPQQLALPADVVVNIHDANDNSEDPHDEENDPVSRARCFASKAVGHGPGDHADESGGLIC